MKNLIFALLLMASPVQAADFYLDWNATIVPAHHEPVVGDMVARYRLQATPHVEWKFLDYSLDVNAWGVQPWQPSSVVGHFPNSWENSDYSIDKVRVSVLHKLKLGSERFHGYVEYYMPLDRRNWGGHGMERHYYLLVGVGGRLF